MAEPVHRAGVVAILGRPNAGKSTLFNRLLGEKLAIVTPKPQTTRSRILGICTREDAQVLFVDTPGRHASAKPLNVALNEQVLAAAADCDVALLLVDLADEWGPDHGELLARLREGGRSVIVVGTKADRPGAARHGLERSLPPDLPLRRLSARSGEGVAELLEAIVARLPESPALYPGDVLSDRPLRFLAAELVREAAFETLEQELPDALATEVVEFDESREDLVRIRCDLIVERASQKKIAIGAGGRTIRAIGIRARREIEKLLGTKVYLELRVKLDPRWSRSPKRLKTLGYS